MTYIPAPWLSQLELSAQRPPFSRIICRDPDCCSCTYGTRDEAERPVDANPRSLVTAARSMLSKLTGGAQ